MGYAENSKSYRLLDSDSNTIIESRDVEFLETSFLKDSRVNPQSNKDIPRYVSQNPTMDSDSSSNKKRKSAEPSTEPKKSQRPRK